MTYMPDILIIREREQMRASAIQIPCPYCKQPAGAECVVPKTNNLLVKQPAHMWRLHDSGCM